LIANCYGDQVKSVISTYLNDNAQTPLNRFVVYMLYNQVCNRYGDKSNRWSLGLNLSVRGPKRRTSATLLIAAYRVTRRIVVKSTVVHITQVALLGQRDHARHLSVEILQLQNISLENPIVWHYFGDSMFSRFDTIPDCDRHTHTQSACRRTDTRRHITHIA